MANIGELERSMEMREMSLPVLKAMEAVATRQLVLTRLAIQEQRPFSDSVMSIFEHMQQSDILLQENQEHHPLTTPHSDTSAIHVVLVSVQNGLFCQPLIDEQHRHIMSLSDAPSSYTLFGEGGRKLLMRMKEQESKEEQLPVELEGLQNASTVLARVVENTYLRDGVRSVRIVGVDRKCKTIDKTLLPIPLTPTSQDGVIHNLNIEGSTEDLLTELFHLCIATTIYNVLLETRAAEQQMRMSTAHGAVENIKETLPDLKLAFGRERRARLTREIAELQ